MRLIRSCVLFCLLISFCIANEYINVNFKNLEIQELIKITSKALGKNILIDANIRGKVDFISNKPVKKSELLDIVNYVLENKGYSIVENNNILRVVKLNNTARYNVPLLNLDRKTDYAQMVTEIFPVYNSNVDYVMSRVRHLISKSAKIVSNKESNVIILTDFPDNIRKIKSIVSLITKGAKKSVEVIKLKNSKALEVKKSLEKIAKSVFNQKIEKEKVAIIEAKENNSIMLVGKKSNINFLIDHIKRIDTKDTLSKDMVDVMYLKNVESKNVLKILNSIIGKRKYLDPKDKPIVSEDEESNSVILMGLKSELMPLKNLINKLDKEKAQVYVQAKIIEVNDEMVDELGVKYGIYGGKATSKGLGTFASSLNGGEPVVPFPAGFDLKIPDISSGLALGASISLLDKDNAIDIVSEPSILAINNKESSIYVGETISVKTSSSVTDGGTQNDNYKREDVGLTLKVKPRISNDNKVTLEINTILEDVKKTDTVSGNADTRKKEVKTTAIVNNGESVILGGLIEDKEEETENKVPLLGDIPILGNLFKHNKKDIRKRSLVIIVTPYLIPKSKDLTYVREQLAELKLLEDRYLEDSLIRLKQKKLREKIRSKDKQKELEELEKKLNEQEMVSTKDDEIEKSKDNSSAEDRLSDYFGS